MIEERSKAKVIAVYDGWNIADDTLLDKYITSLDWLQPVAVKVMFKCADLSKLRDHDSVGKRARELGHEVNIGLLTVRPNGDLRYLYLLDAVHKAIHFVELHKDLLC